MTATLSITESEIKRESIAFKQGYLLKIEFVLRGSPTEVLHILQNQKERLLWDMDLKELKENIKDNTIKLSYNASDKGMPAFQEDVKIEYMMFNNQYYIIENCKSTLMGTYVRTWNLKPLN